MEELHKIIEAIIFVAEEPISLDSIRTILVRSIEKGEKKQTEESDQQEQEEPITKELIQEAISLLLEKYKSEAYAFELRNIAGGYQFLTKKAYFPFVKQSSLEKNQRRLSKSALETLSIIAYRQPVTKSEIEFIRGVNSDYATQKLLDKKLISIVGRSDGPGKPLLYGTSNFFMQYFGIAEIQDLPKLKEFEELEETHLERFKQFQEEKGEAGAPPENENQNGKEETQSEDSQENGLSQ